MHRVLRAFAVPAPEPKIAWFEKPVVQDNMPWVVLGVVVLAAMLAGWLLMRKHKVQATALTRALANATRVLGGETARPVVEGGELLPDAAVQLVDYSEKLGTTRGLVDSDADRATAVARQMLAAT